MADQVREVEIHSRNHNLSQPSQNNMDAQQNANVVFNVSGSSDKTVQNPKTQSLQLLFQLPVSVSSGQAQLPSANIFSPSQPQQKAADLQAQATQTVEFQPNDMVSVKHSSHGKVTVASTQTSIQLPINQFLGEQQPPNILTELPSFTASVTASRCQHESAYDQNTEEVKIAMSEKKLHQISQQSTIKKVEKRIKGDKRSTIRPTTLPGQSASSAGIDANSNIAYQFDNQMTQNTGMNLGPTFSQHQFPHAVPVQQTFSHTKDEHADSAILDRTIDVDSETDSNHDTALTLACAGGHEELVELLLTRGAGIEHRDKKGFTPLILAATAGHVKVVEILIREKADLEAQSERTKDTPLSLACSGGRYEVVELLLKHGANKEHRNVSDYTPLSLAASGGYVNIIKMLLNYGAEINSRTGSKLGISPLMLAAMNGHTQAVKLLLDMGSDINAQIETNRNTALTLACFQGRHEVVSLLLDRKANVEHRAKTGLTPLMEAASGGYIEVGRVLLDKGADVNAAPVPSSRDTALTIAADKGHLKFVELLLSRTAAVEVKNKKGNSPLWLAANGGHLSVVEVLHNVGSADIDSQDNRKVSCLMAAFRKGHAKVVNWMVNHVTQYPSDQEMTRFISTISDKDILVKCHECVKVIKAAKETQARKAYMNASILLRELDMEKNREEQRKAAAAKRRERKKRRKQQKREIQRKAQGKDINKSNKNRSALKKDEEDNDDSDDDDSEDSDHEGLYLLVHFQ